MPRCSVAATSSVDIIGRLPIIEIAPAGVLDLWLCTGRSVGGFTAYRIWAIVSASRETAVEDS